MRKKRNQTLTLALRIKKKKNLNLPFKLSRNTNWYAYSVCPRKVLFPFRELLNVVRGRKYLSWDRDVTINYVPRKNSSKSFASSPPIYLSASDCKKPPHSQISDPLPHTLLHHDTVLGWLFFYKTLILSVFF